MARIGIIIQNWKLPIFKKELDNSPFTYTELEDASPMPDSLVLEVQSDDIDGIITILKATNDKANRTKMN